MQTVRERQRIRTEIATHLEERRYEMCTAAVTLASSCALALVMILLSETVEGWQRTAYLALTALGVVGVVTSVITITLYIHIQRRAKAFWMEELVAIMGTASLQEDHAGFSRALLLYGEIRNEPDIPIPGTVGVYASIFAIAQWLLH
jgi:hypothetical protein